MTTEIVSANIDAETLESVVLGGDLSRLKPKARLEYYAAVCKSLKLNPLTKPFEYIPLQGKLILYATKNCTEQLSEKLGISIELGEGKILGDSYVVKARATGPDGRFVDATGAVPIGKRQGEDHSNSLMKAETKASRERLKGKRLARKEIYDRLKREAKEEIRAGYPYLFDEVIDEQGNKTYVELTP